MHYVPVLKVKRGEKAALGQVTAGLRSRITPVLEIVKRRQENTLEKHLDTAFRNLVETVEGYPRCFVDVREIETDGPNGASTVFERAASAGIVFTPVTGLSRTADLQAALDHRDHGIAIRLTRPEFESGDITSRIGTFLDQHQLAAGDVDLVIDLGAVESMIAPGIGALTEAFMADIPEHGSWRTFTIVACAFPMSMRGVDRHSYKLVERSEWVAWKDNLYARRHEIERLPTFGDCGIQHP